MESQENIKLSKKEKKALRKQNRNNNDRKGVLLIILLTVVTVALLVNAVSLYNEQPEADKLVIDVNVSGAVSDTQPVIVPTVQPTQIPDTTVSEEPTTVEGAIVEDITVSGEMTKEEILRKVTEGVNSIKSDTATYTAVRSQTISLDLEECSLPAFVSIVNKVMDFFEGETITEYSFVNGKGVDAKTGEDITAISSIPPSNELFRLTPEGMADAKMEKDGENTVYTVIVVPESSTMNNPRPPHHHSAGDTFDVRNVELPIGAITKADFNYPGASISITVTPDGKVIRYQQILHIDGVGEGAAMGMTASGKIVGFIDEIWNITY